MKNDFHKSPDENYKKIRSVKIDINTDYDSLVIGNKSCFEKLQNLFIETWACFPPSDIGYHILVVEVKLNLGMLIKYLNESITQGNEQKGNKGLFFDKETEYLNSRLIIINGGIESQNFVKNLNSDTTDKKYIIYKEYMIKNRINIFFKNAISAEAISDLIQHKSIVDKKIKELQDDKVEYEKRLRLLEEEKKESDEKIKELQDDKLEFDKKFKEMQDEYEKRFKTIEEALSN